MLVSRHGVLVLGHDSQSLHHATTTTGAARWVHAVVVVMVVVVIMLRMHLRRRVALRSRVRVVLHLVVLRLLRLLWLLHVRRRVHVVMVMVVMEIAAVAGTIHAGSTSRVEVVADTGYGGIQHPAAGCVVAPSSSARHPHVVSTTATATCSDLRHHDRA